uniref:Transmembrane protein 243, mitochondrial b n=1 Tax=Cyprinus carpio TaxID=7962 RepID=A0A8C1Y5D4_CYPCA
MDDFTTRTYGTSGMDNRPLFGETSARDRLINLVIGGLASLLVLVSFTTHKDLIICLLIILSLLTLRFCHLFQVTIISSFVFPSLPPKPLNIFFAVCIMLVCGSVLVLIHWYRQGDLEPKFRNLIYYMLCSIVLLCICANLYFHDVGRDKQSNAL